MSLQSFFFNQKNIECPKYVFIAFSLTHFELGDKNRGTELLRVGSRITQELKYEYFWVSASCMGFSQQEEDTLSDEEKKAIIEQDVRHSPDTSPQPT